MQKELIICIIIVIAIIVGNTLTHNNTKNAVSEVNKKLQEVTEKILYAQGETENETGKSFTEEQKNTKSVDAEEKENTKGILEKQNIEETPKENPNNNVNTPQPQTPSNNQTTTKQPTTPPKVVETPSCTPKLFYVVFRADFDSLDKLKATAEQYKEIYGFTGYEYMSATDDCGDTYYQLTMRTKDDKLVEYSDIPKP